MCLSTGRRSNSGLMVVIFKWLCSTEALTTNFQLLSSMRLSVVNLRLFTWLKASTTMFSGELPFKHGLWNILNTKRTTKHSCSNCIQHQPNIKIDFTQIIKNTQSDVSKVNWVFLDMALTWTYMEINRIAKAFLSSDKHTWHQMDGNMILKMQTTIWLGRMSLKSKRLKYLLSISSDYY
jgi:hypothetical protein